MESKTHINRCGDRLRDWWINSSADASYGEMPQDVMDVATFRAGYQYPMQKTAVGLRQFVARESSELLVAQRLKRLPQIVHKLARLPGTKLARMEDIGGCRAIFPGGASEINGVVKRIKKNWDVKRFRDYIDRPKTSGYRGVHVVVERDAHRIEIQLRTPGQQAWAETVERLAGRHLALHELKDEKGPPEVLEWLRLAAEGIAYTDSGVDTDVEFDERFAEAQSLASTWMRETRE